MPLALRSIPPFPAVAIQLLRTASNEFARLRELSDLIRTDTAFSGEILRTANSSLYGLRTDIDEQVISSEFDALAIVSPACQVADVLGFEAFRHPQLPTYVELRAELAEKDRKHLPPDAKDLTVRIASAINAIETT